VMSKWWLLTKEFCEGKLKKIPTLIHPPYQCGQCGQQGLHGFCVFLSFRLSVYIVVWVLCDYCEMLVFLSEVLCVLDWKVCALVTKSVSLVFYDDSPWKTIDSGIMGFEFYGWGVLTTIMCISCYQLFFPLSPYCDFLSKLQCNNQ
jgi:hypothetical protein